ncbi:peptide chain release factor N(5)-glutamine methyltransferase [Nocardioides sp.]|uniref:peptide chain release factor N(5)-glutamine methyltransferase n=1 Tax=Nocardioides sp. TaxID=35761 RepID=UPI00262D7CEF|nr:peptide chain release factor N(5)-glutamine methyltransferase [Nocardioides sp.]
MSSRRDLLFDAATLMRAGGVSSPAVDAEILLSFVLGVERSNLILVDDVDAEATARFEALVARRAAREPLQHLTGVAYFRYVDLLVGPGVFVPRPETELLAGWVIDRIGPGSVVVDLCTGSGAIAKAIKNEVPEAEVHAVELSADAFAWAERNLAGTGVDLRLGDAFEAFEELTGRVDVVVCNPPYIPLEAWESVATEARDHDPHLALFSGDDGLDAIRLLAVRAADLLVPGGLVAAEHADEQGPSAPNGGAAAVFAATGRWSEVRDHEDLAGRARFVTARLAR